MSWRPAIKFPLLVCLNIVLILVLSASPAKATSPAQANAYFLPIVRVEWTPPCGGVPFLISPPDGSVFNEAFDLVFDGGYRAGTNDWLEVEASNNPDFENSLKRYFRPAGKRWEVAYWVFVYGMNRWYWRASVWCNGPVGSPPPAGYLHSPYSQTWSFTVKFYPYPPP